MRFLCLSTYRDAAHLSRLWQGLSGDASTILLNEEIVIVGMIVRLFLFNVWISIMVSVCCGHWLSARVLHIILCSDSHANRNAGCAIYHLPIARLEPQFMLLLSWLTDRIGLLAVLVADDVFLTLLALLFLLLVTLRVQEVEDHWLDCRLLLRLPQLFELCWVSLALDFLEDDDRLS